MKQGLIELAAFVAGYLAITWIAGGPGWAGMLGGWMLAMWISPGVKK